MKKKIMYVTIIVLSLVLFPSISFGPGKCSGDSEYRVAVKKMNGFRLIKDYRISLLGGRHKNPPNVSFPITLTSGLKYKFFLIDNPSNESKMIMTIYINAKQEMLIASTYRAKTKKFYPSIEFECRNTGTYYLFFSFSNANKGCGVGIFSVSKS